MIPARAVETRPDRVRQRRNAKGPVQHRHRAMRRACSATGGRPRYRAVRLKNGIRTIRAAERIDQDRAAFAVRGDRRASNPRGAPTSTHAGPGSRRRRDRQTNIQHFAPAGSGEKVDRVKGSRAENRRHVPSQARRRRRDHQRRHCRRRRRAQVQCHRIESTREITQVFLRSAISAN